MWRRCAVVLLFFFLAKPASAEECFAAKPASKDPPAQISVRAQSHLARHQCEDAAVGFRDLAFNHRDFASETNAPAFYLQSINELAMRGRTVCYDTMAADVPLLVALHCAGDRAERYPETCELLDRVGADIDRLAAQNDVMAADRTSGAGARALYESGGKKYLTLFQQRCHDPAREGQPPRIAQCEELGYNAARAFASGRRLAKAISAYRALIAFGELTKSTSPLIERTTRDLASSYEALGIFDHAAEWYEKYARKYPKAIQADGDLARAVLLRLGTGSIDEAMRDAQLFMKTFATKQPSRATEMVLALATHHAEREQWAAAQAVLAGSMTVADRARIDLRARAHALLGRVAAHGSPMLAKRHNELVKSMFGKRESSMASIFTEFSADVTERNVRVLAALDALGEATYALAEERRRTEVDSLRHPFDLAKKRAAINEVEAAYAEVLAIDPVPPSWGVAAQRRIAFMWADLALADPKLKEEKAKPAMLRCLALAKKLERGGEDVHACELWLAKSYPREYHALDEIVPLLTAPPLATYGAPVEAPSTP